jgi:hypothetical protein
MGIAQTIDNILFSSATTLFKAYGVQLAEDPAGAGEGSGDGIAVVGFHGAAISGTLLIIVPSGPLRASMPVPSATERDWLGELANQMLGRVKNRLLAYGVEVVARTPTVLGSMRILPVAVPGRLQGIGMVTKEGARVTVWIDYYVDDHERLANLSRGDEVIGREGDLILF